MTSRPVIFISAVSKELKTARGLAARLLHSMGYDPKDQDMARAEHGKLTDVLRRWIDQSQGVIQLVGKCYGAKPPVPEPGFTRHSYTQFEALYALSIGKPVWYFFVGEGFTADAHDPEPADLAALQQDYIAGIHDANDIRHTFNSYAELEVLIRRIEDKLDSLRRAWDEHCARMDTRTAQILDGQQQNNAILAEIRSILKSAVHGGTPQKLAEEYDTAITIVAGRHGMNPGTLRAMLEHRAEQTVADPHAELREKIRTLREAGRFAEARDFAVAAATQFEGTRRQFAKDEIEMLVEACESEIALGHYAAALLHAVKADRLADRDRDFDSYARARLALGKVLSLGGRIHESAALHRELLPLQEARQGAEHPGALMSRSRLANALRAQGNPVHAEAEHRAVLAIRERVLGAEHPDTLASRNNVALALRAQGRNADAEAEQRAVLALRERALGTDHPDTLKSRNNLAVVLAAQDRHAESETELRVVLAIQKRQLGAEHPETLKSQKNLINALNTQGRHAEAEAEHRAALAILERLLGAEHPNTLVCRSELAVKLHIQGRNAESESEHRAVLAILERVNGMDQPAAAMCCFTLALCLEKQNKLQESLAFLQRAEFIGNKVLGVGNPISQMAKTNREQTERMLADAASDCKATRP